VALNTLNVIRRAAWAVNGDCLTVLRNGKTNVDVGGPMVNYYRNGRLRDSIRVP
jgi:hypothetical protein